MDGPAGSTLVERARQILARRQLIIASNRGPCTFKRHAGGECRPEKSPGGLATAMLAAAKEAHSAHWICVASSEDDRRIAEESATVALSLEDASLTVELLSLDEDVYQKGYNKIANPLLWFVFHNLWDLPRSPSFSDEYRDAWERGYVELNKAFADAISLACETSKDPLVMLQDYHLYLCPGMLRETGCKAQIVHFTHIPWPQPDSFRVLPMDIRARLLDCLLAADVVGFHGSRYVRNFLWTCEQVGGYEVDWKGWRVRAGDRWTSVGRYPISISEKDLLKEARRVQVRRRMRRLEAATASKRVIVRVDRVDPSKNVLRGFEAYRRLLQKHPGLAGKVVFVAMLCPSRESLPQYKAYRQAITRLAREINREFGNESWKPIRLSIKDDSFRSLAAMRLYDVLLVNPVVDGMNLIAKEGPCVNEKNGVLVLSENAGADDEMQRACLRINPFDVEETADALYEALNVSEDERADWAWMLRNTVSHNSSLKWLCHQVVDAEELRLSSSDKISTTSSGSPTR